MIHEMLHSIITIPTGIKFFLGIVSLPFIIPVILGLFYLIISTISASIMLILNKYLNHFKLQLTIFYVILICGLLLSIYRLNRKSKKPDHKPEIKK